MKLNTIIILLIMFNEIYHHRRGVGRNRQDSVIDVYLHADERQYLKKKKRLHEDDIIDCINNPRTKKRKSCIPEYDQMQLKSDPLYKHLLNLKWDNIDDLDTDLINSCKRRYASTYFKDDENLVEYIHLPKASQYAWRRKYARMNDLAEELKDFYHDGDFDINKVDKSGRNALHFAASWGDAKMLKILLNIPGINTSLLDYKGRSALRLAVEANSYDSVVELVGGYYIGPAINIDEVDMLSSLEYAMKNLGDNALQIISFLYEKYVSTFKKKLEMKSLLNLIMAGSSGIPVTQCIEDLILQGVDVNSTDGSGKSLLMYAAEKNLYEVAKVLIQCNANLYHIDNYENNTMMYAMAAPEIYNMLNVERELELHRDVAVSIFNRSLY